MFKIIAFFITTLFAWLCVVFDNNTVRMVVYGV